MSPEIINFLFIGGMFAIVYFFMIRPKNKKDKEQKEFLAELSKGDHVVTLGGMHGKIVEITEKNIVLEVDRGTKIKYEKGSISGEQSKRYKD